MWKPHFLRLPTSLPAKMREEHTWHSWFQKTTHAGGMRKPSALPKIPPVLSSQAFVMCHKAAINGRVHFFPIWSFNWITNITASQVVFPQRTHRQLQKLLLLLGVGGRWREGMGKGKEGEMKRSGIIHSLGRWSLLLFSTKFKKDCIWDSRVISGGREGQQSQAPT